MGPKALSRTTQLRGEIMDIKIYVRKDGQNLKIENKSTITPLAELTTSTLVVLFSEVMNAPVFNWVSPSNRKYDERGLYREPLLDEEGYFAYKSTIFPVMTVGLGGQQTSFSAVSFRDGEVVGSFAKIPVHKTIYPEQTEIPPTTVDEINGEINDIKDDVNELEIETDLQRTDITTLQGETIAQQGQIDGLISTTDNHGGRITSLEGNSTSHGVRITNLEEVSDGLVETVAYTPENGHLTFFRHDGSSFYLDLPLELIVDGGYYDELNQKVVLVLANGDEIKIPIGDILQGIATESYVDQQITLRQAIVKVNQTVLSEPDLVSFMQTLDEGIYRIRTGLWGHEFLFISDMNLPVDPDVEEPVLELRREYSRYTANGTSYRYDFELLDWVMSAGGGPGGGVGDIVTIQLVPVPLNAPLNFSHALGTPLSVTVNFTHSELQVATLRILRGATEVEVRGVNLGENVIDLTPHIRAGSNSITLRATDGERSRSISYNITGVAITLTSTFNDAVTYGANVDIPFRVQTEAERKVYFTVDGVTETITNVQLNNIKSLTGLTHGVKEIEIQAAAIIGETEILSNKIRFNVIVSLDSSPALISSKFDIEEATRGSLISIDYIVYNPVLEFNPVTLKVDGEMVGSLTVGRQRQF